VRKVISPLRSNGALTWKGWGAFLLLTLPGLAQAAERWKIQFFYDKASSSLNIQDLACPSTSRCVAVGSIEDKKGHVKGTSISTNDGGQNWSLAEVSEQPISLFFLNDSLGWMATDRGAWTTNDGGRTWKKLEGLKKGILEVYFLSPLHGYAIGFPKAVYETVNGGKNWTKLAAADRPDTGLQETVYECISFQGKHGVIAGNTTLPGADETPAWLNPSEARHHRERQSTVVVLETMDGGIHWEASTSALYGRMSTVVMMNDGSALALFEYHNYYTLPSRVYKVKFRTNSDVIFAERDRAVTDIALLPDGGALIAAVEPPGSSNQVPIPGKLKMLRSANLKMWEEMDVDYKAVAQRAMVAAADAEHLWVATDTGMILKLDKSGK
jgi:Photosynthesis system II assembly factor YCF48